MSHDSSGLRATSRKPRVYLAGKIEKNGWRHRLVPGLRQSTDVESGLAWEPLEARDFTYVGPFFISCDHGCSHGPGKHGLSASGGDGLDCANNVLPNGVPSRRDVVKACLRAVDCSDAVFAWIEPTAYGTLVEVGYALGRGIPVFVATSGAIAPREHRRLPTVADRIRTATACGSDAPDEVDDRSYFELELDPDDVRPYSVREDIWFPFESDAMEGSGVFPDVASAFACFLAKLGVESRP